MDYFKELCARYGVTLNPQQEQAARLVDGPALLLAVPGSGKTTVIVSRLGNMVLGCGIDARSILTVTFSNAAAQDMRRRYTGLFGGEGAPPFSTIHSLCNAVVRLYARQYRRPMPRLMEDNTAAVRAVYCAVKSVGFVERDRLDEVAAKIGYCKNLMMTEAERRAIHLEHCCFADVFNAYEAYKKANGLMDFDDMCLFALDILKKCPPILAYYQNRFRYLNVDEAQDTSLVQHRVLELLAAGSGNLFMVGDEDQSIYGFRGAFPQALLDFGKNHPGALLLRMERNYRSSGEITSRANAFIRQNTARLDKEMFTENEPGPRVLRLEIRGQADQAGKLVELAAKRREGESMAVLYRNNDSGIPVADALERAGMSFYVREGKGAFFENYLVRDVLAFLRLSENSCDLDCFERVYNKTCAYLSRAQFDFVVDTWRTGEDVFDVLLLNPACDRVKIRNLQENIAALCGKTPLAALLSLEREIFSYDYLKSPLSLQRFSILKSLAAAQPTIDAFIRRLDELRELFAGGSPVPCGLTLSTVHAAKGLEYDRVVLIDLFEGVFPAQDALDRLTEGDRRAYEEEVRLFYVGATRARRELVLMAPPARSRSEQASRFVEQFFQPASRPPAAAAGRVVTRLDELDYGMLVLHPDFGRGEILHLDAGGIGIRFERGDVRRLSAAVCLDKGLLTLL